MDRESNLGLTIHMVNVAKLLIHGGHLSPEHVVMLKEMISLADVEAKIQSQTEMPADQKTLSKYCNSCHCPLEIDPYKLNVYID